MRRDEGEIDGVEHQTTTMIVSKILAALFMIRFTKWFVKIMYVASVLSVEIIQKGTRWRFGANPPCNRSISLGFYYLYHGRGWVRSAAVKS